MVIVIWFVMLFDGMNSFVLKLVRCVSLFCRVLMLGFLLYMLLFILVVVIVLCMVGVGLVMVLECRLVISGGWVMVYIIVGREG